MTSQKLNAGQQKTELINAGLVATEDKISLKCMNQALAQTGLNDSKKEEILIGLELIDGLTKEATSRGFCTKADIENLVAQDKLTAEQKDAIIAALNLDAANKKVTVSAKVLGKSVLSSAKAFFTSVPGAITIITALFSAATTVVNKWKERLQEAANEASEQAKESAEIVKNLSELKTEFENGTKSSDELTSALREQLKAMGKTSAQIDNLIGKYGNLGGAIDGATEAVLAKAKVDADYAVSKAEKNLEFVPKSGFSVKGDFKDVETGNEELDAQISEMLSKVAYLKGASNDLGQTTYFWTPSDKSAKGLYAYCETLKEIISLIRTTASETGDDSLTNFGNFLFPTTYGEITDAADELQEAAELYGDAIENQYSINAQKELFDHLKEHDINTQSEFGDYISEIENRTEGTERYKQVLIDTAKNAFPEFAKAAGQAGGAASNFGNKVSTSIDALKSASDAISSLQSAYNDLADDGYITTDTISSIKEAVGDSVENWDEYQEKLLSVKTGSEEFNQILSDLTYKILEAKVGTDKLATATEDEVAAVLRENGVTNAAEVAHDAITLAKAKELSKTTDLKDMTLEEIQALAEEKAAGDEARIALIALIQAKLNLSQTKISTADDIDNIIGLANAAGASAIALTRLSRVKELLLKSSLSIGDLKELETIQTELYNGTFDYGFDSKDFKLTTPKYSSKDAKDGKDKIKDIKEKLADLDKEAALDNLKQGFEEFDLVLERINDNLDTLKTKLDLTSEKDYYARAQIISDQYNTAISKGAQLREEFDRLTAIEPANADEANELASQLESVGDEMRSNVQDVIEYRREMQLLPFNALADSADAAIEGLEEINDLLSKNNDIWFGGNPSMNGYADAFNLGYLLPTDGIDEVLERTRKRNDEIEKDEQATQDAISEIKRKALEMQYRENAAEREKARKELYEELEEAESKITVTSEDISASVSNDAQNAARIITESSDATVAHISDNLETTKQKFSETAKEIADEWTKSTGGLFGAGSTSTSGDTPIYSTKWYNGGPNWGKSTANDKNPFAEYEITSMPGARKSPTTGASSTHAGVDRSMAAGTKLSLPIATTFKGSGESSGRGIWIELTDENGYILHYQHLSGVGKFSKGESIPAGKVFAVSGNTGVSTGAHLHEEYYSPDGINVSGLYWSTFAPKYSEGISSHPGGLAIVGENHKNGRKGGAELALFPNGEAALLGTNGAGLYDLPKGTEIISHDDTEKLIPKYAGGTDSDVDVWLKDLSKGLYGNHDKETYLALTKQADEYSKKLQEISDRFAGGAINIEEYSDELTSLAWENSKQTSDIYLEQIRKRKNDTEDKLKQAQDYYAALLKSEDVDADTLSKAADDVKKLAEALDDENEKWQQAIEGIGSTAENYFKTIDKANEDARTRLEAAQSELERQQGRIETTADIKGGAVNKLQSYSELLDNNALQKEVALGNIDSYRKSYETALKEYQDIIKPYSEKWDKYFSGYNIDDLFNTDGTTTALFDTLSKGTTDAAAQTLLQNIAAEGSAAYKSMSEYRASLLDSEDEYLGLVQQEKEYREDILNTVYDRLERAYDDVNKKIEVEIEQEEYLNTLDEKRLDSMKEYHEILRNIDNDMIDYKADLESSKLLRDWLDPEARENLFNTKDYAAMEDAADAYSNAVNKAYNEYLDKINSVKEGEEAYLEVYGQQYSDALAAAERSYELSKLELDVAKKQRTLENTLNERNVRQFVGGRWIYTANATDVQNAQKELTEAETEYNKKLREIEDARKEGYIRSDINDRNLNIADLQITADVLNDTLEDVKQKIEDNFLEPLDELGEVFAWLTNYNYDHDVEGGGLLYYLTAHLQGVDPTQLTDAYNSKWGKYPKNAAIYDTPNYQQAIDVMDEAGYSSGSSKPISKLRKKKLSHDIPVEEDGTVINGKIYTPITTAEQLAGIFGGANVAAFNLISGRAEPPDMNGADIGASAISSAVNNISAINDAGSRIESKITQAAEYMVREIVHGLSAKWLNIDTVNVQNDDFSTVMKNFSGLFSVKEK